jgi:serine protease Do
MMRKSILMILLAVSLAPAPAAAAALRGDQRWSEFLRTPDRDRAFGAARRLVLDGYEPRVFRRAGGDFVVVTGPKAVRDENAEKRRLEDERSPVPVAFTRGGDFLDEVTWRAPAHVLAQAEFRSEKRVRLSHDGLNVAIEWRKAASGENAPVMIGRIGSARVFETRADDAAALSPFGQVRMIRLDPASPRPSVVLTTFTGGAHCCMQTTIATQKPDGAWTIAQGLTLDGDGYAYEDLDGDGVAEMLNYDNSFLYAFSSYAGSFSPSRVSRVIDGEVRDVTRLPAFQPFLRQSAHALEFGRTDEQWRDNGFLGGWVAAKSLIGQGRDAWTRMEKLHQPFSEFAQERCPDGATDTCADDAKKPEPFMTSLRRHLQENGYPLDPPARAPGAGIVVSPAGHVLTSLTGLDACAALTLGRVGGRRVAARRLGAQSGLTLLVADGLAAPHASLRPETGAEAATVWAFERVGAPAALRRGPFADAGKVAAGERILPGAPVFDLTGVVVGVMRPHGGVIAAAAAEPLMAGFGVAPDRAASAGLLSDDSLAQRMKGVTVMIECAP